MALRICIFEDNNYKDMFPLVYTRAVYELLYGMNSLMDKIVKMYPKAELNLFCRDYLGELLKERYGCRVNTVKDGDNCLFVNGRALIDSPIPIYGDEELGLKDDVLVYARLKKENCSKLKPSMFLENRVIAQLRKKVKTKQIKVLMADYLWTLVNNNKQQIEKDFNCLSINGQIRSKLFEGVYIINKKNVYIGKNAKIMPGTVINASDGLVYLDDGVTVMPNSVITGPAFIGKDSLLKACTRIYGGTSIGRECKVSGEINASIIQGYSNKQHEGFLGHSYIGSWVNLAAATDNSNLKNNYSSVNVDMGDKKLISTGLTFVGMFVGDYSKTGIGTKIQCGTVIGIMCSIMEAGIIRGYMPSFTWIDGKGKPQNYMLDKGIETLKTAMARRTKKLTCTEEKMIRFIHQ